MGRFKKIPKTKEALLKIWIDKELNIENAEKALGTIQRLNYYRLSGYAKYFYDDNRKFQKSTSFDDLYNLYLFDDELRNIILRITEEIELNFRSYIASYIATTYGACAYCEENNFQATVNKKTQKTYYNEFLEVIGKKKEQHKDRIYIKHYINKYEGDVPIWVLVEILSFTDLSKFIKNMKNCDVRNIIKENLVRISIGDIYLPNLLMIICDVRNMCAHYEKIFNLNFLNAPKLDKNNTIPNKNLYDILVLCKMLVCNKEKWNNWIESIDSNINKYGFKFMYVMGFEENWKQNLKK